MKDILFDEKIAGSLHLTPGNAYEDAGNGNQSEITGIWCLSRGQNTVGTISFDGQVIRQDGHFVTEDLEC